MAELARDAPAPAGAPAGPPLMESRRIRLRVIQESDRHFLYQLMTSPRIGGRVRFGGSTPSPDQIAASLWESVLAQFVIEGVDSGQPLGLVAITSPSFRDGFAYLSALGLPSLRGLGMLFEGVLLGFNYAFTTWPLRKIYMEATEESLAEFSSGLDLFFVEEGRLREHVFSNGRYVDLSILAVYRQTWAEKAPAWLRRLSRSKRSA